MINKTFYSDKASINFLEEILLSTNYNSTDRAKFWLERTEKANLTLCLQFFLSWKKDLKLFKNLMIKINEVHDFSINYYNSENKILPVIISGNNTNLTQTFLLSLQRTLSDNDMLDIMPETNYKAALSVLERWKIHFLKLMKFAQEIDMPVDSFEIKLQSFDRGL